VSLSVEIGDVMVRAAGANVPGSGMGAGMGAGAGAGVVASTSSATTMMSSPSSPRSSVVSSFKVAAIASELWTIILPTFFSAFSIATTLGTSPSFLYRNFISASIWPGFSKIRPCESRRRLLPHPLSHFAVASSSTSKSSGLRGGSVDAAAAMAISNLKASFSSSSLASAALH